MPPPFKSPQQKSKHGTAQQRRKSKRRGRERRKMGSLSSDSESAVFMINPDFGPDEHLEGVDCHLRKYERKSFSKKDPWLKKKKKKQNQVFLEGYVEFGEEEDQDQGVTRTKSLTDDDLDELKGCLDLGFGFSYDEIPELCNTLPALELCYSMSQKFLDEQQRSPEASAASSAMNEQCPSTSGPIANWKISSPEYLERCPLL